MILGVGVNRGQHRAARRFCSALLGRIVPATRSSGVIFWLGALLGSFRRKLNINVRPTLQAFLEFHMTFDF